MLIDIPKRTGMERRGCWQRITIDEAGDDPIYSAIIWCPGCGKPLALQRGHHIADDGQISPSVGHPTTYPPCGWHTNPKLLGWVPGKPATIPYTTCERCTRRSRLVSGWGTWAQGAGLICAECFAEVHST